MTKTYTISRGQWVELEHYLGKINQILNGAEEFDTSKLEEGVPALMFRGNTYIVNPKDTLSQNL